MSGRKGSENGQFPVLLRYAMLLIFRISITDPLLRPQKAAAALSAQLPDLHADTLSRLYTLKTFREKLGNICLNGVKLSERDCKLLATYLAAKGECAFDGEVRFFLPLASSPSPSFRSSRSKVFETADPMSCLQVVKFSAPLSTKSSPPTITESDRSTLSLLSTLSSLSTYITSLESRIATEQAQIQRYGVGESKNLALAKSHLVARKRLERLLEERVGARDKVQEVVLGIERAVGDEEVRSVQFLPSLFALRLPFSLSFSSLCRPTHLSIMVFPLCTGHLMGDIASLESTANPSFLLQTLSALSLGTTALRSILSSPTLQLSNIEATTSALDDALISAQEVNEAVDSVPTPLTGEMEDEVDAELKALVEEEKREKEEKRERDERERVEVAQKKLDEAKLPSLPASTEKGKEEKVVDKAEKLLA
jgi:charged multivesicular body protein 7